jgi:tetratricopeptide (TPR) repeat protein
MPEAKGSSNVSSRFLIVPLLVALGATAHAQNAASTARQELVAAKSAMYDSNFRNDRDGLRAAIGRAQAAARADAVRAMAHYYVAWGEWALSHAELQAGDMTSAQATLLRAERAARAGLALRPDDVEFVVMLADALIWRLVADPAEFSKIAPEVRTLRDRALTLQPENPRALIMDAGLIFNNPPERGGDRQKGLTQWKRAIALFEQEAAKPAADALRPDWGLALSYAWACDLHLAMRPRQVDEARALARKALEMRPDFWYVKEVISPRLR